jgi:enoyl-CoA hydratase/carnithine racemase
LTSVETGTDELLCDVIQRVAVVTLNKPHKKNALGDVLTPALRQVLLDVEHRSDVGCVMITGAGNAFCSGGDVTEMGGNSGASQSRQTRVDELAEKQKTLTGRIFHLSKPTIAALPGAAAGAGFSIALACDLRIASESAFLMSAFKNVGLSGDYGASWFLPRLVGLSRAKSLMFHSPRLTASEALEMGLVDEVFSDESFREDALAYAVKVANGPTKAFGMMKHNMHFGLDHDLGDTLGVEAENMIAAGGGAEAREAISAFREKRQPVFFKDEFHKD